jgi:hypothetical protein
VGALLPSRGPAHAVHENLLVDPETCEEARFALEVDWVGQPWSDLLSGVCHPDHPENPENFGSGQSCHLSRPTWLMSRSLPELVARAPFPLMGRRP